MSTIKCHIDLRKIDKAIKLQRSQRKKITLVDPTGLRLAINNASASWNVNYRRRGVDFNGNRYPQRTLKLGDLNALSPNAARLKMEEVKSEVRDGGDPAKRIAAEKRKGREQEYRDRPLRLWLQEYQEQVLGNETKYKATEYTHAKLALEELGVSELSASDLTVTLLRNISVMHKNRPATGRQRFGSLSRFIDFLVSEGVLIANPAKNVPRWQKPKMAPPRETVFTVEELKLLWSPASALRQDYLTFIRFMMLVPLRATEAANLTGKHIFLSANELRLSSQETKNKQYFIMPITDRCLRLINVENISLKKKLFPLSTIDTEPMKSWSHFNKSVRTKTTVGHFNLHSFRRTFSSLLSENSPFSESLVDSLLNHKRSSTRTGVMRAYQHAKNVKQRREIMEWWSDFLEREVIKPSADASGDQS